MENVADIAPVERQRFPKKEKLCSQKSIEALFAEGKSLYAHPFRLVFQLSEVSDSKVKLAVSVPKKLFKRAVQRNLLKRRIREAYRLNKAGFYAKLTVEAHTLNFMLVYVSKELLPYKTIEERLVGLLENLAESVRLSLHSAD